MIKPRLPVCPRECAESLRATKVATRSEIDVPLDIWDNLTSENYDIWRCGYCCFVWGEKLFTDPYPRYSRRAIGYFGGLSGQQGWHLTPHEVLPDYPDVNTVKRARRRR
jgi:hypothetical protein